MAASAMSSPFYNFFFKRDTLCLTMVFLFTPFDFHNKLFSCFSKELYSEHTLLFLSMYSEIGAKCRLFITNIWEDHRYQYDENQ